MNQIPPHALWIGSIGDLSDLRRLYDLGIGAVVQLAYEEAAVPLPHDLIACRFPLLDGEDNRIEMLDLAIATVAHLMKQETGTFVCCQAGLSRSPAIAAAALSRLTGQTFAFWVERIAAHHPVAIHPHLRASLQMLGCV